MAWKYSKFMDTALIYKIQKFDMKL